MRDAEHVVNAAEEYFAEVDVEPAGEGGDGHHGAEYGADERALLLHFFLYALVDEVEELGHTGKDGDVALLQARATVRWCSSTRGRRPACRTTTGA